ncbi:hypothetical protein TTHERM_00030180 (macronuclear) [Tetrahymena thermophila SB210]|uniref:Uncharacterized protein n=1 Tax=Tetrahymena thermophila (strain SB210) TaxID=312017 RepID=Q22MV5_TETTS|nr:hypothetical protein TTHERM_00030180 [Tetrahymena thermophila SB210]EAR86303.2 hypothetical protein TTHERM_00030180 [Tetrahymena thermophila SB210]|eukprot:XP_976915.2 hypothetical protein TTHERM_00030180 [Tetrahymena thermophila SB210]
MKNISNNPRNSKDLTNKTVSINLNVQIENQENYQIEEEEKEEGQVPLDINLYKKSNDKHSFLKKVFISGVRHAQFDGEVCDISLKILYEILRVMGLEANEFLLLEGYKYGCFQSQYGEDLDKFTKSGCSFRKLSKEKLEVKQQKQRFDIDEYMIWLVKNLHRLKYDTTLHFHYMRNVRRGIYQIEKNDIKLPAFHLSDNEQLELLQKYKTPKYMKQRQDSPSLIDAEAQRTFQYFQTKNKKYITTLESKKKEYIERQREYSDRQRKLAKEFYNYHNNKYSPKKYPQVTYRINTQGVYQIDSTEDFSLQQTNNTRCHTSMNESENNYNKSSLVTNNKTPSKTVQYSKQENMFLKSENVNNVNQEIEQNDHFRNKQSDNSQKGNMKNKFPSLNTSPNFSPTKSQNQRYFISTRSNEKQNSILIPKENQKLKLQIQPESSRRTNTIQDFTDVNIKNYSPSHKTQTTPNSPTSSQIMKQKERSNRRLAQAKKETDKRMSLILKNLKEMTQLRQENAVIPYDLRSQSEISEHEDKKELSKIDIIPYQAELYDLNKDLTKLKGETQIDIASLISRVKQNNQIRADIYANIQDIADKRMRNNEIIGKQGAIKAKRRLSECSYRQQKQEIKELKYQALHDKDQTRQYRIEHFLSMTSNPTSKSPSQLKSLQNSPHITPKFKQKIGDLLSQNPF